MERTFAWLGRNRHLAKDYGENPGVSEAWVYLGMLRLLVKRLARARNCLWRTFTTAS